jgi:hypothetical protein
VTLSLCRADTALLGQGGRAFELEIVTRVEAAFLLEVVVNRGVDSGAFLQISHLSKAEHRTFTSSKRQVEILRSVIQPATRPKRA